MYFCLGENDVIVIADLPDHVTAAALSMAASASGLVRTKTTALLVVAEADEALSKTVSHRAPGASAVLGRGSVASDRTEPRPRGSGNRLAFAPYRTS